MSIEHLIRQEGTAIFVAVTLLHRNDMSLPMILNTFIGMALCVCFVSVMRRIRPDAFSRHRYRQLRTPCPHRPSHPLQVPRNPMACMPGRPRLGIVPT